VDPPAGPLPPEAVAYYARGREATRLGEGHGPLELARTCEILERWLPGPPADVLDVGGGPGAYAVWLARRGYRVGLVDAVPLHVTQALDAAASAGQPFSARVGDARRLEERDGVADAVLLLGPLYHLTERAERLQALREARRVLRPGGLVFAAGVSRFASLLSGLFDGLLADPAFGAIVERDLADGQHRNPTSHDYFTTAFFHHPDELRAEVAGAGFTVEAVLGVEGPGWALPDLATRWADPARRAEILAAARAIEGEPSLLGFHAHIVAVGRVAPGPADGPVDGLSGLPGSTSVLGDEGIVSRAPRHPGQRR
jgi:ubiquinone/menaquinone biosynthesis C-methylase UbiE